MLKTFIAFLALQVAMHSVTHAQDKPAPPREEDYYRLVELPVPKDLVLEIGGMDWLDKKRQRLAVCTRRGEVWVVDNVYASDPVLTGAKIKINNSQGEPVEVEPEADQIVGYKRMLFGLHEPLGMLINPGHGYPDGMYMVQRGELTRAVDTNGDDRLDEVETFCDGWEISGNYHEYAFGPKIGPDGMLWLALNRPFGGGQEPKAHWRGWAVKVDQKGKMHAVCPGLRSPAGLGANATGELFYTDNQGDHVAVCKLGHLQPGVFHGNPEGFGSLDLPGANFKLPFENYPKKEIPWGDAVAANPKLVAPAVWFPYPEMGKSHTDVLTDTSQGKFGPFAGQTFIGDLTTSQIVRVSLEKVGGKWQGATFPFRKSIGHAVLRMNWGTDGNMFIGGSGRGWGNAGKSYGLSRMAWTGKTPFEIKEIRSRPNGFELVFTLPVDPATAADVLSYRIKAWTYNYSSAYGDKPRDTQDLVIEKAVVAPDGLSVRLVMPKLMKSYVHAISAPGVHSAEGLPLLHNIGYYTLNEIAKK